MSAVHTGSAEFGRIRALIWPIHRYELRKVLPMLVMFFLITFNYNVLRTMKDTLVVTAESSGAEAIPFIKVWVMFPGAVFMTFLFTRLTNRISRETVFYVMMSLFLAYFFIFAFFLYPHRESIHPHQTADALQALLPLGCKGFIAMFRNWTFTLFYVMSELWGNIIVFLLFWGFANQVTQLQEAKRFYGLFGFGANLSGIVAGQVSVYLSAKVFNPSIPLGSNAWDQSMLLLLSLVLLSGGFALVLFRWLNQNVFTEHCESGVAAASTLKGKMSLRENFTYLFKSKYLLYLTFIVVSYNVVINLVEVVWKDQVKLLYPNPSDYNLYINQVSAIIGTVATLAALFVSGNSLRKFGWTFTAMLTPLILLLSSLAFFGLFFFKESLHEIAFALMGMSPLSLIVFAGAVQNVLSRGAKYTVFDATKEMAFIPLSTACKVKGKAAIDGVCNRFGKSGGSVIHLSLLILCTTFTASAPYVALILVLIIGGWICAIRLLGREFHGLTADQAVEVPIPSEKRERLVARETVLTEQHAH